MFGSGTFGTNLFGSSFNGYAMAFNPLSKTTTYQNIRDYVEGEIDGIDNWKLTNSFYLKQISMSVQKFADDPRYENDYIVPVTGLTITGSANPYTCDLSTQNPYYKKILNFVHVTAGGTRTQILLETSKRAENYSSLSDYASSIVGSLGNGALRIWKGSSFTITTATDTVEFEFIRQAIATGVTMASYVDVHDSRMQEFKNDCVLETVKFMEKTKASN